MKFMLLPIAILVRILRQDILTRQPSQTQSNSSVGRGFLLDPLLHWSTAHNPAPIDTGARRILLPRFSLCAPAYVFVRI